MSAKAMASVKKQVLASPCIIDGSCKTDPQCRHCKWRGMRSNDRVPSKKRSVEQVVAHAVMLEREGVDRLFLPSGWMGYELPEDFYDYVKAVKGSIHIEVFGLFGALNRSSLEKLKDAGIDGILCGIESPNEEVYKTFRPGGDTLSSRIDNLHDARELGLKLWTGFLYGLGETEEDIKNALIYFRKLDIDSLSILPFEPFPNTEMEAHNPPNLHSWAKVVAIAKIFLGDINVFTSFGAHNMAAFGRNSGANAFYFFPNAAG